MEDLKINCTVIFPEKFNIVLIDYSHNIELKTKISELLTAFESVSIQEMNIEEFDDKILQENSSFNHQSVIHLTDKLHVKIAADLSARHNHKYHNCPNLFFGTEDDVLTKTILLSFLGIDVAFYKQNFESFSELMRRIIYREYDDQPIETNDIKDLGLKWKGQFDKKKIFKDSRVQASFDKHGFVKVSFLDTDTIQKIRAFFHSIDHKVSQGFYTTTWSSDLSIRLKVNDFLTEIFQPKIELILNDYEFQYGNFFVKNPSDKGDCLPHQDWNTVDEEKYVALTLWCALEDMSPSNGNLRYLPNSHQFENYQRGRHMPIYFEKYQTLMHKYLMKDIPMKAGELLIFNQRLVHGSKSNQSQKIRLACGGVAIPAHVPMIHHVGDASGQSDKVRIVDASNHLYSKYDTFDPINDVYTLEEYHYIHRPMHWKELLKVLW